MAIEGLSIRLYLDHNADPDIARAVRQALSRRHIKVRIAHKGCASKERLGRRHWVVERTLVWLNSYRRLTIRDERDDHIHEAFLPLGCVLICWNDLQADVGRFERFSYSLGRTRSRTWISS